MGFTPLFKLLILVFLGVTILLEDFSGWKLRKIMRNMSQTQKEIPINCILTYKIICARSGILLSLTNQLIGMLLEITLTKKFE